MTRRVVALMLLFCALGASPGSFCTGCDFGGAHLQNADFTNGSYIGANFAGADLQRASFRGARIVAANFAGADLRSAAFDAADCTACNFSGAKLDGATFTGTHMTAANLAGFASRVDDEQLRELLAGCISCNFRGARLNGRDFSGSTIVAVDLSAADLRGTKFDGSVLCWNNVALSHREMKCVTMTGAQVTGASFAHVRLCDDPLQQRGCTTVDPDTLRRYSGSPLAGAVLR